MPTGYTAKIGDGKETTKQFILNCAKAFIGRMREESSDAQIPDKFEPDTYHKIQLEKYESELVKLSYSSDDEIQQEIDRQHKLSVDSRNQYTIDKLTIKDNYESAINNINKWNIPSSEHYTLKEFCISQLKTGIDYDCNMTHIRTIPSKLSISEWKVDREKRIREDIKYHRERYLEEIESINKLNIWIKQLRDSLENME